MKLLSMSGQANSERRNERGAALITMLMLSMLLLSAGGALVVTTMMAATTAIDATAEMQAFYGAEVGLQQTMNALRGHVYRNAATPKIDLRTVVEPGDSNLAGDPATASNVARMSKWLPYTNPGIFPSRIAVGNADNNGVSIAYMVSVRDPDVSKVVTYSTSGQFEAGGSGCTVQNGGRTLFCQNGVNSFTLTYVPQASTTITAYPATTSGMGSFTMSMSGNGANIPQDNAAIFRLTVNQTAPWSSHDTYIGRVWGNLTAGNTTQRVDFQGSMVKVSGTQFALCGGCDPLQLNHPTNVGPTTTLSATITAPQPRRIIVHSTGYGPKGAIKRVEMVVRKGVLDLDAPAPVTMAGASDGSAPVFDTGSSGSKVYSGMDYYGQEGQLPALAVTGSDVTEVYAGIPKPDTLTSPLVGVLNNSTVPSGTTGATVPVSTPDFLQSADAARDLLNDLQDTAESQKRYYKPAAGSSYTVNAANTGATKMTFVDGDCQIDGGSGLLIVTGRAVMNGNPNFNGVILVLGGGRVERDGGGEGFIYGAIIIARFDRYGTGGFLAPTFLTNGGGNSTIQYDSLAVSQAMASFSPVSGGMREF